ncbi:MAG TPA: outer membrane lipoprotein carrier protein LolA [Stellaceae bacterium]|jgi:hypothetical protein|nr:outer membrane lipoprotein carrier protein LolA [Stellaceae bacterium]
MIRHLLVGLCVFALTASLASAQSTRVLLRPGEVLSGRFTQQLQRAGFTNALDSEGSFVLSLDKGIVWRIEKPVSATIAITPGAFVQWVNGKEVQHLAAAKAPMLGDIYRLLAASLSGDRTALANEFTLSEQDDGPAWRLLLQPRATNDIMASQLQSVTVSGDRFIQAVVIQRPNGDTQTTRFVDLSLSTGALPPEDQALLAAASQ